MNTIKAKIAMDKYFIELLVGSLIGSYLALLTWLGKRAVVRIDDHEIRLRAVETDRVTHRDIDELRQSLTASVVHACNRIEENLNNVNRERQEQHEENREQLGVIMQKIDENEERSSNSRHAIRDEVHALALKMAVNGFK